LATPTSSSFWANFTLQAKFAKGSLFALRTLKTLQKVYVQFFFFAIMVIITKNAIHNTKRAECSIT
jgi:hypothetical protein